MLLQSEFRLRRITRAQPLEALPAGKQGNSVCIRARMQSSLARALGNHVTPLNLNCQMLPLHTFGLPRGHKLIPTERETKIQSFAAGLRNPKIKLWGRK